MRKVLGVIFCLLLASSANAAPITYYFSSGSAQVTATANGVLIVDATVALDGIFVDFDAVTGQLTDFAISAPMSADIAMEPDQTYGGFDTFVIESASLMPGVGYSSIFSAGGPTFFSFLAGPIDVAGVYSAYLSTGPPPAPAVNEVVPFAGFSLLNGTINTTTMELGLDGITLAEIAGSAFGEDYDLIVKADITWFGVVPEPSTALLLGLGLVALAARSRVRSF